MKKILLLAIVTIAFSKAGAQIIPVTNTTITKGYNGFSIDNVKFPLNSVIVNVLSTDTSMVEIDLVHTVPTLTTIYIPAKKRVKYINGTTGVAFPNITALRGYVDSFLYSH